MKTISQMPICTRKIKIVAAGAFIVFLNETDIIRPTESESLICATGKGSRQNRKQATSVT